LLGPTGLAFDSLTGNLYIASTADNAVYVIPDALNRTTDAGTGSVVFNDSTHLHGPLGLVLASNGDLIASNGDAVNPDAAHPSTLVEFTPQGTFVSQFKLDPASGAAFGIAFEDLHNGKVRFAAVDDATNMVKVWTFKRPDPN
jgi:DNA-binding beta-propeller fold protein YncE